MAVKTAQSNLSQQLQKMVERAQNLRKGKWEEAVAKIEDFERPQTPEAGSCSDVKMTLTSQFNREVGSRLYNKNPTVRVQAEAWAGPMAQQRAPVEENLLNIAMERTDFFATFRDCVTDSFVAFGVLWHGLDENDNRLPRARWVRWEDVWFDPDVKRRRDSNYIVKRCRLAKYKLIQKYAYNDDENLMSSVADAIMKCNQSDSTDAEDKDRDATPYTANSIVYYEVYTKVGLQAFDEDRRKAPTAENMGEAKMYVILEGSWDVIYDGEWPTPYHILGDFPCSVLSYYESRNLVYPAPPLEPGVPWMEALNKAVNDLQTQYKFSSRMILAYIKGAGADIGDLGKAVIKKGSEGAPVDFVELEINSALAGANALRNIDIRRYLEKLDLGDDRFVQKLEHIRQLKDEWYRAVGLNDFMYFGDTPKQDRSAQATQSRERHAMSRIADMQSCVDAFASEVLRKMLFTARVHDTEQDVAGILGKDAGKLWGTTMPEEQMDPAYWEDHYANNPDEVPEGGTPQEMAQETVSGGVDVPSWLDSTHVAIELGSTSRKTPEQEEESIAQANNQLVPSLHNMGMPLPAAYFVGKRAELLGMTAEQVQSIIQSGMTSQQLIETEKQLNIQMLQMQLQQLQGQPQQQQAQQQQQAEQAAQAQALEEEKAMAEQDQRQQELEIRQQEADAKSIQAMRPKDTSKP